MALRYGSLVFRPTRRDVETPFSCRCIANWTIRNFYARLTRVLYPNKERTMDWKTLLIECLLAGFFALACFQAQITPPAGRAKQFADFFKLSGRIERLRRSRWQWFSLVAFMLVLRLQQQLPLILELMVAIEFTLFMALPKAQEGMAHARTR
jgi:hypothetical protein